MNKIKLIANRETNYVYHMLSVAKCGYDNDYGRKYRERYAEEDLQVIKQNESLLVVIGGEHCGELHNVLVWEPARAKVEAKAYYESLLAMIEEGSVPEEWRAHSAVVESMAKIMVKYYDSYVEEIWPVEKGDLDAYLPQVQAVFDENRFTEQAETATGLTLQSEFFYATMVTSVQDGAEAINISEEQDVFGIVRPVRDSVYFMAHEFIIFLLFPEFKKIIKSEADMGINTYNAIEGLAEFYMKQTIGETGFFCDMDEYVRFYEEQVKKEPMCAVDLYRAAMKWKK